MKKISTLAKSGNEILKELKMTIGLDLGDRTPWSEWCPVVEWDLEVGRNSRTHTQRRSVGHSAADREKSRAPDEAGTGSARHCASRTRWRPKGVRYNREKVHRTNFGAALPKGMSDSRSSAFDHLRTA